MRQALKETGLSEEEVQIGEYEPQLKHFRFARTLKEYIEKADLVIIHAGAGTIIEALRCRKRLIVVVNSRLMDNHQLEIAEKLHVT